MVTPTEAWAPPIEGPPTGAGALDAEQDMTDEEVRGGEASHTAGSALFR